MIGIEWLALADERWPLDLSRAEHGPLAESYFRFYGIDLERSEAGARHSFGWFPAAGEALAAHAFRPSRPEGSCVVLHGYFDHSGLFRHPMRWALRRALSVLAYDMPGHGLSTGARGDIDDFSTYREALESACALMARHPQDFPRPWHIVAQSAGAAVAIDYLLCGGSALSRVVLLAPLYRPAGWRRIWLSHALRRRWQTQAPRTFGANSGDAAFCRFVAERDPLQHRFVPLGWIGALRRWCRRVAAAERCESAAPLVLQGELDGTVAWRGNLAMLKRQFPRSRHRLIAGARHHLANETRALRELLASAVDEFLERDPRCATAGER